MTPLKVLFIGGTGRVSATCAALAIAQGMELTFLNRGTKTPRAVPPDVTVLHADIRDEQAARAAIGDRKFDVVVNWVAYTAEHIATDIRLFRDRIFQYIFISSASAYQKPVGRLPIRESTPLHNPYWQYSRDKIAAEDLLISAYRETGFPGTIVRPSHTYDFTSIPILGGWTAVDRMRRGEPVIVHGDGTSLWALTHHEDFARAFMPMLAHPQTIGEAFHITTDQVLTWNQIYESLGRAAGVEPKLVHLSSAQIAKILPDRGPGLLGDKAHSVIFDNTKIRQIAPGWHAVIPWSVGARQVIEWHDADASRRAIDPEMDAAITAMVNLARD